VDRDNITALLLIAFALLVIATPIFFVLSCVEKNRDKREVNWYYYEKIEEYQKEVPSLMPFVKEKMLDGKISQKEEDDIYFEYIKLKKLGIKERLK